MGNVHFLLMSIQPEKPQNDHEFNTYVMNEPNISTLYTHVRTVFKFPLYNITLIKQTNTKTLNHRFSSLR